nr:putative non-LTR retroelement reverse transcriptase [Ipomoea batatas]
MRQTLELYVLNPDAEEEDNEVWMWEDSSKFTVRSAFLRTNPNNIDVQDAAWMDVWKIGVASRIRMFIWLVKHKKIPCNAERKKRHLTDYGNCLSCANAWEDTEHVIHKCLYARYVWAKLMSNQALSRLDTLCFSKGINTNVTSDILKQIKDDYSALKKGTLTSKHNRRRQTIQLKWSKPLAGTLALNVDNSWRGSGKKASCVGVLRDENGGFGCQILAPNTTVVEGWAIMKGLEWAWRKGVQKMYVECDSKKVVEWIEGDDKPNHYKKNAEITVDLATD